VEQEDRDSKSRLLEWGQKQHRKVEFVLSEQHERGGRGRQFTAEVQVDGKTCGTGKGHSKKKAEQEAARDLVRAREDCRADMMRARHRLSKLLLRQQVVYDGNAWTGAHRAWLARQRFEDPNLQTTFDEYLDQVLSTLARRDRLDARIEQLAADSAWTPMVRRLCCLRGISTMTGFALAVEIGDWTRFDGNSIGAYLGLVPSEHSSGASKQRGGITRTGNSHVRRLLIEAALHHMRPYRKGKVLRARWDLASPAARARGDAGNRRLYARWQTFQERKKRHHVATVAIARELAGWCWSVAVIDD